MNKIYSVLILLLGLSFLITDLLYAQQEVTIRDLNTYDPMPEVQGDLSDHPLVGELVTFDAVIVGYPRNSGLATPTSEGVPGRIHTFVVDVNAATEGPEGMYMQFVVEGAERTTLEGLTRGDVIRVEGELTFFGSVGQFDAFDVEQIGTAGEDDFAGLEGLLEPVTLNLTDVNQPSDQEGLNKWIAENYSDYINMYVKFEGLEMLDNIIDDTGRPWFVLTDGNTIIYNRDTSLRYRNDRTNYGYNPDTGEGLDYNWRRLDETLDGPFTPPPPGSVVDVSGFLVLNPGFDPVGLDESGAQSTVRISPWDDGVIWTQDGTDPANRAEPEGWPNDFVTLGFAPTVDNVMISPEEILANDEVTLSADILLPEEDYTLLGVELAYEAYDYTADYGDTLTVAMTENGNTFSHVFGEFDAFTRVNYTITATAETPEGIQTNGRFSGTFYVGSETQTAPVEFTPAGGLYTSIISVSLATETEGATIYFTLDGSDPDESSDVYATPISVDQTTTIKAIAYSNDLDASPIAERTYQIDLAAIEVGTLAELRSGTLETQEYEYTGEAVVTHTRSTRNQKYLMDDTGGILIDDNPGVIESVYTRGDVMTGLFGSMSEFGGLIQFNPAIDPGEPVGTADIVPVELALADLVVDQHESMLVKVDNVTFLDSGDFSGGSNYDITDPSLGDEVSITFRTNFGEADYIGTSIPEDPVNLTALVGSFNGAVQLTARDQNDFELATSIEDGVQPFEFDLAQNYPNPFNPTTNIRYSIAEVTGVNLVVYDILGRRVATLVNQVQTPGVYNINFDASRFASGTYIYRLEAGDFVSIKKMMLIK